MSHPPYSPDLAPNDFFVFPYLKNKRRGEGFSTPETAVDVFRKHVLEIPQYGEYSRKHFLFSNLEI